MAQVRSDDSQVGFTDALRHRSFLVLFAAEVLSLIGDQLGRVALSFLVFDRTNSVAATAASYALTFFPAIIGGSLLGRFADRFPRLRIMAGLDLARALLYAVMALPMMSLGAIVPLVAVAVLLGPVFSAALVSYLAHVLRPPVFRAATGLRLTMSQAAQVIGFAAGGALVMFLHPRGALFVDACTFAASAVLIAGLMLARRRGRIREDEAEPVEGPPPVRESVRSRFAPDWRVRYLVAFAALAGFFVVPEGLGVPYGQVLGVSSTDVGLLIAAIPFGGGVGAVLMVRLVRPRRRLAAVKVAALLCGLPLVLVQVAPSWPFAVVCWFLSGACGAYLVEVVSALGHLVPDRHRAGFFGMLGAVLLGAQGVGIAVFGAVAYWWSVGAAIALAGGVGSVIAAGLVLSSRRHDWDAVLVDPMVVPSPGTAGSVLGPGPTVASGPDAIEGAGLTGEGGPAGQPEDGDSDGTNERREDDDPHAAGEARVRSEAFGDPARISPGY